MRRQSRGAAKEAWEGDCCWLGEIDRQLRGKRGRSDEGPGTQTSLLRAAIRAHRADVLACYEKWLGGRPGVEGKVVLTWQIESDGHVSKVAVRRAATTLPGEEVPGCIIAKLVTWEFPRPSEKTSIVTYP